MSNQVGLSCKAYKNTGTYGTPTWVELTTISNVTQTVETDEAPIAARADSWETILLALNRGSVDIEMPYDSADTVAYQALRDAWIAGSTIDLAFMNGDITTSDNDGLRAECYVTNMARNENLADGVTATFTVKPARTTNAPVWYIVP